MTEEVFVSGTPRPQGSMTLARDPRTGKEFAKYSGPTYEWRQTLHIALSSWWGQRAPIMGPVKASFRFVMPRPSGHWSKKGGLKPSAPHWHTNQYDNDKLCRSVNDGLTYAGVWGDDGQVAWLEAQKVYQSDEADRPGVHITLEEL